MWDCECTVQAWNLRHRVATRYKRQASDRKSYRRSAVWEGPDRPRWSINPAASGEGSWRYTAAPNPNCCKNGNVFSAARCPSAMASSAR